VAARVTAFETVIPPYYGNIWSYTKKRKAECMNAEFVRSAGHVAAHPAVRVRAALRARASGTAQPAAGRGAAPVAASAAPDGAHHQLLRRQT
jgi:hypothetical protein